MSIAITDKSQNPFISLFWKESRQLVPFMASMLVIAGVLQLLLAIYVSGFVNGRANNSWFMCVALIGSFSALFAAAASSTLFATEKEEGTFTSLQLLPVTSAEVAKAKISAAATLTVVFFLVSCLIALVCYSLAGINSPVGVSTQTGSWFSLYVLTFGLATLEFFLWGWLMSLLMARPLNAAIIAILMASLSIQLAIYWTGEKHLDYATPVPYANAWKFRLLLALVVLLNAWKFSGTWLSGQKERRNDETHSSQSASAPIVGTLLAALTKPVTTVYHSLSSKVPTFSRLAWQAVRQSSGGVAVAMIATVALGVSLMLLSDQLIIVAIPLMIASGGFAGLVAFSDDQRRMEGNFLATRGVSSFQIWLSRVFPWTIAIATLFATAYLAVPIIASQFQVMKFPNLFYVTSSRSGPDSFGHQLSGAFAGYFFGQLCLWAALGCILCFAAGQFASLVLRRRILAFILTAVLCIPLVVWLVLMMFGGVPIWWSVLPLLVVLLFSGWLALRANMNEASVVKRSVIPSLLVVSVFASVITAVVYHRTYEISAVALEFDRQKIPASPAILDQVDQRFNDALAKLDLSDQTTGLLGIYPTLLTLSELPDADELDPEAHILVHFKEHHRLYWRNRIRQGEEVNPTIMLERVDQFIDENQAEVTQLHQAIEFAWQNREQFERLQPGLHYSEEGGNPLTIRAQTVYQILQFAIEREIYRDNAGEAWRHLEAFVHFSKLDLFTRSERAHWYVSALNYFERWTLCEDQTPELLNKGLQVVLKELVPFDDQRLLEYQYHELIRRNKSPNPHWRDQMGNLLSNKGFGFATVVWQLPCERTRTERLLTDHCQKQLENLKLIRHSKPRGSDSDSPPEYHWYLPDLDKNEFEGPLQPGRNNDYGPFLTDEQRSERNIAWRKHLFWCHTTMLPKIDYDEDYFEPMVRDESDLRRNKRRADESRLERRWMLALQMYLVRHKLNHGEFPKDLAEFGYLIPSKTDDDRLDNIAFNNRYGFRSDGIEPIFYFPSGIEEPLLAKKRQSSLFDRLYLLPTGTPFISNRPLVFQAEENREQINPVADISELPFDRKAWTIKLERKARLAESLGLSKSPYHIEPPARFIPLAKVGRTPVSTEKE